MIKQFQITKNFKKSKVPKYGLLEWIEYDLDLVDATANKFKVIQSFGKIKNPNSIGKYEKKKNIWETAPSYVFKNNEDYNIFDIVSEYVKLINKEEYRLIPIIMLMKSNS